MDIIVLMNQDAIWNEEVKRTLIEKLKEKVDFEFEIIDIKRSIYVSTNTEYYCCDKDIFEIKPILNFKRKEMVFNYGFPTFNLMVKEIVSV